MNALLILPGGSIKNKDWLEEVAKKIEYDGQIRPIYWDHWQDETQKFDAKEKADVISGHFGKFEKIDIIAKSIGTLVTAYLAIEESDLIGKIILCGIPINDLTSGEINIIHTLPIEKVVVFQNDKDPHGSFEEVSNLFPKFKIIKKEAGNHDYPYYSEIQEILDR